MANRLRFLTVHLLRLTWGSYILPVSQPLRSILSPYYAFKEFLLCQYLCHYNILIVEFILDSIILSLLHGI